MDTPKLLAPVAGKAMVDHVLDLYGEIVSHVLLVVHPSFEAAVRAHCRSRSLEISYVQQPEPTGMLDAILLAAVTARAAGPDRIWITWCDQVAIHPDTIATLARVSGDPTLDLVFPTARQAAPYIHIERDAAGRITRIRHRREGDAMPPVGESDMGLFSLSRDAYFEQLPRFAQTAGSAPGTRERNFLPFIPWLVRNGGHVRTFPCRDEQEAVGINTAEDRAQVERYLRQRTSAVADVPPS